MSIATPHVLARSVAHRASTLTPPPMTKIGTIGGAKLVSLRQLLERREAAQEAGAEQADAAAQAAELQFWQAWQPAHQMAQGAPLRARLA
jgi:hypothetical protein